MARFLKIRVRREVFSKTSLGVSSEETFRFPADNEMHCIEISPYTLFCRLLYVNEDFSKGLVIVNGRQVMVTSDEPGEFCANVPPRFRYWAYLELVEECFEDEKLEGYSLSIHEEYFVRDTYSEHESSEGYVLPVILGGHVYLKNIKATLHVTGIDATRKKVRLTIDREETEVSLDKPGEYCHSVQSGYNDSFEASSKSVTVTLIKEE